MSNGRADASTVAFQESLRCFNVSTANTSQTSQFRTKAKRETGRNKKINLYHFFIIGHVIPNISTWGVGNEEAKNLNLKAYQLFVGPIQCHGIRYIALEFLFVNRSPLHFNHLWISHIVFWAINFWNPLHYLLDEGWYFLRWRTMAPPFGAKSWQRWPWLCVHRPHLPLNHPILPPRSFQPPHRPSYQPHSGHSSTRRAFLPPWSEGKVHDDEAFVLIVVEPWLCVQRPQLPPTRKVWLPTVLMILTHRPNDPQVSISDADDFIVVVA